MLLILICIVRRARSTLFPYTTLFRSNTRSRVIIHQADSIKLAFLHAGAAFDTNLLIDNMYLFLFTADGMCRAYPLTSHTSDTVRSEEHTSELQSRENLVCRLLLEKKK